MRLPRPLDVRVLMQTCDLRQVQLRVKLIF